jgi:hypothetical protein
VSSRHRTGAGEGPFFALPKWDRGGSEPCSGGGVSGAWHPVRAVGALIAARRPSNRIGWLLLVGALSISSAQLAWTYVLAAHYHGGRLIYLVGWLGNWLPWPAFAVLILLLLLFPNGRLLSRRWRPVAWAAVTWGAATMFLLALYPELIADPQLQNPIGLTGRAGDLMRAIQDSALLAYLPLALVFLSALSLSCDFAALVVLSVSSSNGLPTWLG